jgi:phosphatidate cytidylyltransferase
VTNFQQRLLLTIIALPALIAAILLIPGSGLPVWNVLVIILTALGTAEAASLFIGKTTKGEQLRYGLTGALLPTAAFLELFFPEWNLVIPLFTGMLLLTLFPLALAGKRRTFSQAADRCRATIFTLIYPGFFLVFLVRVSSFPHPGLKVLFFLTVIFSNDTFAYLSGRFFGKNSFHPFPASPNKTVAGFIGGFAGALFMGLLFLYFLPAALPASLPLAVLVILFTAMTADIGDLVESAFKRAADMKDSGTLMLGRGGVLDSADSVLFSAPFFYYIVQALSM